MRSTRRFDDRSSLDCRLSRVGSFLFRLVYRWLSLSCVPPRSSCSLFVRGLLTRLLASADIRLARFMFAAAAAKPPGPFMFDK